MRILPLFLILAPLGCAATQQARPRPFTTDGCSLVPNGTWGRPNLWLNCCREHDYRYWKGGTQAQRLRADFDLNDCVAEAGHPDVAYWMSRGVRVGGTPYLPTPFRWGYGWPYPRGYTRLTDGDKKLIEESRQR